MASLSAYINDQITNAKRERLTYEGPFIATHYKGVGKDNFMPRIGNNSHCAGSNNGYARKPHGGFYNH